MDKEYLIKLTLALYRVTEFIPEKEPLKNKLRERALRILGDLSPYYFSSDSSILDSKISKLEVIMKDIETLEDLLEIAQSQDWADFRNFLVLNQEYVNIRKGLVYANLDTSLKPKIEHLETKPEIRREKKQEVKKEAKVPPRQKKILELLKKQEKIQVWELQKFFPGISKRTLRRDLENLLNQDFIDRIGKWNETFYKIRTA